VSALKSINQHCYDLAEALVTATPSEMCQVSEWLKIAAGIKSVDLDWIRFDDQFGWCSGADQYELARQDILKRHVTSMAVFLFVWGALESAIEVISPPPHPDKSRQGKINSACHYISTYFNGRLTIAPYPDILGQLTQLLSQSASFQRIAAQVWLPKRIGGEAFGLYIVYKLRNEFAHGDTMFPVPDHEHRPISEDPRIVELATRIVLLSIQMLVLVHCADKGIAIELSGSEDDVEILLTEWLRILHFENAETEDDLLAWPEKSSR
jgi:hypothetical protein